MDDQSIHLSKRLPCVDLCFLRLGSCEDLLRVGGHDVLHRRDVLAPFRDARRHFTNLKDSSNLQKKSSVLS